ncbi:MAG: AI-2E family transporter [Candidatus Magasanikbacteria bacterium]|nr:AI-2E family transporter [Candidatus Magasanikbacteria bacterium]
MHKHITLNILLVATGALFVFILWPYLTPLVLAAVVAVLGYPVYRFLQKKLKDKGSVSAFIATIGIVIIIGVPLSVFIGLVTKEVVDVVLWARQYVTEENLQEINTREDLLALKEKIQASEFTASIDLEKILQAVGTAVKQIGTKLLQGAGTLAAGVAHVAVGLVIFLIALFFFLRDGEKLILYFRNSPYIADHLVDRLTARFKEVVDAIVFGNLTIAALQGLVLGVAFPIFGLSNGLLIGLATALLALIPAVGPLLIILPTMAYLGFTLGWGIGITFAVITYILATLIDNLLKPILLQKHLRIHSLIIFLSLLGGIGAFGLLGILYGPLIAAVFLTLLDIRTAER